MVFASFRKILCGNLMLPNGIDHVYFYEIEFAKLIICHLFVSTVNFSSNAQMWYNKIKSKEQ